MTDPTPAQILAVPMGENDADATTVRDYLIKLLAKVWAEGEGPFGNSGWDFELALPLVKAGFVEGEIDGDGYLDGADFARSEALIAAAIQSLGAVEQSVTVDVAALPPFSGPTPACRKCGAPQGTVAARTRYRAQGGSEHVERECGGCGFTWLERCANADFEPCVSCGGFMGPRLLPGNDRCVKCAERDWRLGATGAVSFDA